MKTNRTRFTLRKGNLTTNTYQVLAVSMLRSKGWKVVESELGGLI